jgi:epoxyqueuosine reductase
MNYNAALPRTQYDRLRAWISRYAWGEDYHETVREKLQELAAWIEQNAPHKTKAYVDTGPLIERVYAKYAGVGWFGKNTCIINQKAGSWLFLGCILTDLELDHDTPMSDRCGRTRCIDACPTHAIPEPTCSTAANALHTRPSNCAARYRKRSRRNLTSFRVRYLSDVCP